MRLLGVAARSALAVGAVLISVTSGAARDDALARAYAMAFSAALEAQRNCPGTRPDESALAGLERAANLSQSQEDDAFLSARFSEWKTTFQGSILEKGAIGWCAAILKLFGPASTIAVIRTDITR